jgi:hypothetical protein
MIPSPRHASLLPHRRGDDDEDIRLLVVLDKKQVSRSYFYVLSFLAALSLIYLSYSRLRTHCYSVGDKLS